MQQFLIETFLFNDAANKKMIRKINELTDKEECIRYMSHLINSQNKWMARINRDSRAPEMNWWDPLYSYENLTEEWDMSLQLWIDAIRQRTEEEILKTETFIGFDGGRWEARFIDIALQLNFHSIHHRAQMQLFIRAQGIEPEFIDYIGTKYRKLDQ